MLLVESALGVVHPRYWNARLTRVSRLNLAKRAWDVCDVWSSRSTAGHTRIPLYSACRFSPVVERFDMETDGFQ